MDKPTQAAMSDLVERLRIDAEKEADASKLFTQVKSLRQADNPEGRTDLYASIPKEATLSWKAADRIEKLEAALRDIRHRCLAHDRINNIKCKKGGLARNCAAIAQEALEQGQ